MKKMPNNKPQNQPPKPKVNVPTSRAPMTPDLEREPRQKAREAIELLRKKAGMSWLVIKSPVEKPRNVGLNEVYQSVL
jgi:hypothetical protein